MDEFCGKQLFSLSRICFLARDSLGAQLVSRFFGKNGAVVLMAPWFGLVWLGYGGDVRWEGVVRSHGGDGSFAKIHTSQWCVRR